MKIKHIFIFLVFLFACSAGAQTLPLQGIGFPISQVSGGSFTLGESLNNVSDGNSLTPLANLFTTPNGSSGFTVQDIKIFQNDTASHSVDVGVYSTTGSPPVPNSLICHSGAQTVSGSGVKTITVTGCGTLSASTNYAMAWVDNGSGTNQAKARFSSGVPYTCPAAPLSQDVTVFRGAVGSVALPASWGGTTSVADGCFEIQIDMTCVGACGTIPSNLTLIDMQGLSNGVQITAATLEHFQGCGGNITGVFNLNTGTYAGYTGSTAAAQGFVNNQALCGVSGTGAGDTIGLAYASNTTPYVNTTMNFLAPGFKASVLFPVKWTSTMTTSTTFTYSGIGGSGETVDIQILNPSGTQSIIRLENQANSSSTSGTNVTDGNLYYVCLTYDGTSGHNHSIKIFDNTGTLLNTEMLAHVGASNAPTAFILGTTGGETQPSSGNLYQGRYLLDPTGAFACTP